MRLFIFIFLITSAPILGQNDSISIEKLFDEAYSYEASNPEKALKLYRVIFEKSKATNYKIGIAKSLQYSGIVHSDLANYDSSIYYYKKALPYSIDANYRRGTGGLYINIGNAYDNGRGAERDAKKAAHYWGLAAMGGDGSSRYNLGRAEFCVGNVNRALKHLTIAVRCGDNESLMQIKQLYSNGFATKNDYAKALRAYQAYLSEIKSDDRDKAAAYSEKYKYI